MNENNKTENQGWLNGKISRRGFIAGTAAAAAGAAFVGGSPLFLDMAGRVYAADEDYPLANPELPASRMVCPPAG
ncbi:hypothetical protein JCM15765_12220 [Paradesulfitobacterium aromaticivorans]